MKFHLHKVAILIFVFSGLNISAQTDSLKQLLKTAQHDTTRMRILDALIEEEVNDDIWPKYNDEIKRIAEKLLAGKVFDKVSKSAKKYLSSAINNIGYLYSNQGDFKMALKFYQESLNIQKEIDDKKGVASTFNNMGYIYDNLGDPAKALDYYTKSLAIREEILKENPKIIDNKKRIATSLNNVGTIYNKLGDMPKCIEYFNKSLQIEEEIGNKVGVATSLINMGGVYKNIGDIAKALEYFKKSLQIQQIINDKDGIAISLNYLGAIYIDQVKSISKFNSEISSKNDSLLAKALKQFEKSLKISEEAANKQGIAHALNNIGAIYDKWGKTIIADVKKQNNVHLIQEYFAKALDFYNRSLKIKEEIGDKSGMSYTFNNIAAIYFDQNDLFNAEKYSEHAYRLSKELGYPQNIEQSVGLLKNINVKKGNYKSAFEFYTEEIRMRDSIANKENYKKAQKQQAKYEYSKKAISDSISYSKAMEIKNIEISRQEAVSSKQRIVIGFVVSGLLIVIVFLGFLYRLFMQKKRANVLLAFQKQQIENQNASLQQANEEINAQKDEIEAQRDIVINQKNHIEEIHKEVSDSIRYAKRIQQAMMPDLEGILSFKNQDTSAKSQEPSSKYETPLELISCNLDIETYNLNFESFIIFRPKDVVSGDFYWSTRINEWLIVTVADCTGHGVPGAFMSMLGISFLNEIVRKKEITQASQVLNQLRSSVIDALKQKGQSDNQNVSISLGLKDGMDMAFVVINTQTLEMQFAGANNPIWIIRALSSDTERSRSAEMTELVEPVIELVEIKGDKMPVAIHDRMDPYTNNIFQLQKGDIIYLATDGYEDQFGGPRQKKFLSKNLKNLLLENSSLSMLEQKEILVSNLTDWIGNGEQIDDITLIGIKI